MNEIISPLLPTVISAFAPTPFPLLPEEYTNGTEK